MGQRLTDRGVSGREDWGMGRLGAEGLQTEMGRRERKGREKRAWLAKASSGETVGVWGEAVCLTSGCLTFA